MQLEVSEICVATMNLYYTGLNWLDRYLKDTMLKIAEQFASSLALTSLLNSGAMPAS